MVEGEPLKAHDAKKKVRAIIATGEVIFTKHATDRMAERKVERSDVLNVLRAGTCAEAEWESGEWRHRLSTPRIWVVVSFESETELVVVTAGRYQ